MRWELLAPNKDLPIPYTRQIADALRTAIASGELAHDAELPGEAALAGQLGVSRGPVIEALEALAAQGYVVRRKNRLTRVRRPPFPREIATDRYAAELARLRTPASERDEPSTAFLRDVGAAWSEYRVEGVASLVPAGEATARLLDTSLGARVWRRSLVEFVSDVPVQTRVTVLRGDGIIDDERPDLPTRWRCDGGALAEFCKWFDAEPTAVRESLVNRPPTNHEAETLGIDRALRVYEVTRQFMWDGRPSMIDELVFPAEGIVWQWETTL